MQKRNLKYICDSIQGLSRSKNKDGIISIYGKTYNIWGVFDGVSSASGAHQAVKNSIKFLGRNHSNYFNKSSFDLSGMIIDLNDFLRSSDIFEPYLTCSIIYIPHQISEKIKYANIGDSRVYSISTQYVLQLTIDDSDPIVKNILTRYLGMDDLKKTGCPEIEFTEKNKSHTFLICTDGFYSVMESNPKNLKEIHRLSNLKSSYYIKKGMQKVIVGSNNDDASYVIVRWTNV